MSGEVDEPITFGCYYGGWFDIVDIMHRERMQKERKDNDRDDAGRMQTGNERQEHQFREEARVERNVRNFVDEETVEYATLVWSDDDEDERLGYSRYKKGSGELKLSMGFDSLEAFKKAMHGSICLKKWLECEIYSLGSR
ncbi:unnamed protein product [Arabis nemorensis]|uniref:Uncharacterized protein n=1 Tax=Arabis nemorensis TaxID=586526 RepID=A0A565AUF4_9BRAS|nr:unnamed protein product [Arabis nemorensis]